MQEKIISELKQLATEITLLNQNTAIDDVQEKAKMLYEKLTVLRYVYSSLSENNLKVNNLTETISENTATVAETLEDILADVSEPVFEPKEVVIPEPEEDINDIEVQPVVEEDFMQKSNVDFADMFEAVIPEPEIVKNDMEEVTPDIPEPTQPEPSPVKEEIKPVEIVSTEPKMKSLNDRLNTTIVVGLNDKIGFINHLFDGSSEDFNRVISQLNTIATEAEAKQFINTMIKPDYNNWIGKEEYEARLISLIESKFN